MQSVTRNGRIDLLNFKRWILIITLSAYNRTPINDLVAAY